MIVQHSLGLDSDTNSLSSQNRLKVSNTHVPETDSELTGQVDTKFMSSSPSGRRIDNDAAFSICRIDVKRN